ncbi:MAG: hypothetical protein NTU98_05165 [Bacteroidetes bacterium]|nr:hypothetical protein [Bacteroidota bacterium]
MILLFAFSGISCSHKSSVNSCRESNYHNRYGTQKNKNNYSKKYGYKSRTVKKDYVIKNGIAR